MFLLMTRTYYYMKGSILMRSLLISYLMTMRSFWFYFNNNSLHLVLRLPNSLLANQLQQPLLSIPLNKLARFPRVANRQQQVLQHLESLISISCTCVSWRILQSNLSQYPSLTLNFQDSVVSVNRSEDSHPHLQLLVDLNLEQVLDPD